MNISKRLRGEVLKRDSYKCVICGSKENLHIDHIIPIAIMGASNNKEYLQTLCKKCHLKKSGKEQRVIRAYLKAHGKKGPRQMLMEKKGISVFPVILTKTERETLEEARKKLGLRSLADFMRAASRKYAKELLGPE